ncbi:MAG: hypothetical protein DRQ08_05590 [Candidatus Latescibacterota bacterium]|nr:MAG: hypothetical protein DRQ08_05590 [Candidatus Latescibacterota bacterium]
MKELSALLALVLLVSPAHSEFTQEDRELLISLKVRMEEIDKRFEEIDKRFEQVDKRFEQIDKRFEQIDERFEFIQNILVAMFGVFGGLCAAFVGLLLWDRRTFKERAKEEALREVEERSKVVEALRRFADVEPRMAEVLRSLGMIPPS